MSNTFYTFPVDTNSLFILIVLEKSSLKLILLQCLLISPFMFYYNLYKKTIAFLEYVYNII